jgi:nucleoside-diphosphate-sugar epimerase
MRTICVTGAGGMTGVATVMRLLADGYRVVGADLVPLPSDLPPQWSLPTFQYVRCDLTDYGDTVEVLSGVDAVVHLANVPAPTLRPAARTLHINTAMNTNVFLAATHLGLERVVWSSSETILGLNFDADNAPRYLPVDEEHSPHPTSTYALSKVLAETTARHLADWSGIPFVGLRLSNVIRPEAYAGFPQAWADPTQRQFNLWSYIDVEDAAAACSAALNADVKGADEFIIASPETTMPIPTQDLIDRYYPTVEVRRDLGSHESLLSSRRARDVLGFTATHSWRDHLSA